MTEDSAHPAKSPGRKNMPIHHTVFSKDRGELSFVLKNVKLSRLSGSAESSRRYLNKFIPVTSVVSAKATNGDSMGLMLVECRQLIVPHCLL
jgi:hypothetical protein